MVRGIGASHWFALFPVTPMDAGQRSLSRNAAPVDKRILARQTKKSTETTETME